MGCVRVQHFVIYSRFWFLILAPKKLTDVIQKGGEQQGLSFSQEISQKLAIIAQLTNPMVMLVIRIVVWFIESAFRGPAVKLSGAVTRLLKG